MKEKRVFIITGANGAIGKAIAHKIALDHQNQIVLLARNEAKLKAAKEEILRVSKNELISYLVADLSDQSEIKSLADSWVGSLDVLVNNAAACPLDRIENKAGIEMQFACNVLGYFWMAKYLRPILKESKEARIVNVASYYSGGLDLSDLEFKKRSYDNNSAYRQSKQANRMLTRVFAALYQGDGITVNSCHPGDVPSSLASDLGFGGSMTALEGADTPAYLALSSEFAGKTGLYFEDKKPVTCRFEDLKAEAEKLYEICNSYEL